MPDSISHELFGKFELNRALNWFEATCKWRNEPVQLVVVLDTVGIESAALATAEALWTKQEEWDKRIRAFAIEKLLPVKNDGWLEDDEEELTAQQFNTRLNLRTVIVRANGEYQFCFDDGDLFWGHTVSVFGSQSGGPSRADIAG